jgi:hypothetical protein
VLVLLAGCGDIATVTADSAQGGSGGSAVASGGGGQAGTTVPGSDGGVDMITRTCDAPQASLNGRATYVMGSVAAVDPAAPADPWDDCADFAADPRTDQAASSQMNVTDGSLYDLGGAMAWPTALAGGAATAGGCSYVLRFTAPVRVPARPCVVTFDYELPQP